MISDFVKFLFMPWPDRGKIPVDWIGGEFWSLRMNREASFHPEDFKQLILPLWQKNFQILHLSVHIININIRLDNKHLPPTTLVSLNWVCDVRGGFCQVKVGLEICLDQHSFLDYLISYFLLLEIIPGLNFFSVFSMTAMTLLVTTTNGSVVNKILNGTNFCPPIIIIIISDQNFHW